MYIIELTNLNKCLFAGQKGGKYSAKSVGNVVKSAAERVGIHKNVTAHTFRHSFATHQLENGTSTLHIYKLLGHYSSKTTEIYTHIANTDFKRIINPFDCLS